MGKQSLCVLALLLVPGLASAASFTPLGFLNGVNNSHASAVSADGTTVVGRSYIGTRYEAFQWYGGVMTGLGVLAGDTDSVANGASNTGLVVGRSYAIVQGVLRGQAFVWTPWDGMARLQDVLAENGATGLAGWTLEEAHGISADGQWIVGTGINPNGNPQAFLANVSTSSPGSGGGGSGGGGSGGGGSGGGGGALDGLTLNGLLGALALGMRRRRGIEKIKFVALLRSRLCACTSSKLHAVSKTLLSVVLPSSLSVLLGGSATTSADPLGSTGGCPVDMVQVGPLCVDKYEASVWSGFPASDGRPRGTQFGRTGDDYPCSVNGNDCSGANPIFAVSVPDTTPSASITWFQAQQACMNVGKRLPTNAEWQGAAAGTPTDYEPYADDGVHDCNTSTANQVVPTGSRRNCASRFGAFDMVGNLLEYTADWIQGNTVPFAPSVGTAGPDFGDDFMRGINPAVAQGFGTNFPGVLVRGGGWRAGYYSPNGSGAGVFALNVRFSPADAGDDRGFRCVR